MTTLARTPVPAPTDSADSTASQPTVLCSVHDFAVGLDGRASGDDGRHGRLAAAVHYAARMAAQLDSALSLGPLKHLHVDGPTVIEARVGWGIGGECLLEGVVRSGNNPRLGALSAVPAPTSHGHMSEAVWVAAQQGTRSAARVDAAVRRVHARTGAAWTVLLDSDLTALRLLGDLSPGVLAVLSSRTQGVILGLGDPALSTLTLVFTAGTVVVIQLADSTLMFLVDLHALGQVAEVVATAHQALLAQSQPAETDPETAAAAEPEPDATHDPAAWNDDRVQVPTGARFAGMLHDDREPRTRRWMRLGRSIP
jgi:hypothetical protein